MLCKVRQLVSTTRGRIVATASSAMVLASAVVPSAHAAGTADTAVVTGITGIVDNVIATITSIAPVCLGIFAAFIVWKYGKKIFNKLG